MDRWFERWWGSALVGLFVLASCGAEPDKAEPVDRAAPDADLREEQATGIGHSLLPPGATIAAGSDPDSSELVFSARESPDRLLDWFRGTGNGAHFVLESELQEGAEHIFLGRVRDGDGAFTVRIAPGEDGGTTGMILVTAR